MSTTRHRVAAVMAIAYFAALAGILLWPSPVDRPIDGTLLHVIDWLHRHGLPEWLVSYSTVEFTANIALFIPFGIILALPLPRRKWWLAVAIAAAVSAGVELAQALLLPERLAAWSDIVANTSGAFIGALLVFLFGTVSVRRAERAASRV